MSKFSVMSYFNRESLPYFIKKVTYCISLSNTSFQKYFYEARMNWISILLCCEKGPFLSDIMSETRYRLHC